MTYRRLEEHSQKKPKVPLPKYQGLTHNFICTKYMVWTPQGPQLSRRGERFKQIEKELIQYMIDSSNIKYPPAKKINRPNFYA